MRPGKSRSRFDQFAKWAAKMLGRPTAFVVAVGMTLIWAASGPLFGFSDAWQPVINTGTTVLTEELDRIRLNYAKLAELARADLLKGLQDTGVPSVQR
ncbi:MAG: low affinity iron permease family protein [Longimicrobiales bacterium]